MKYDERENKFLNNQNSSNTIKVDKTKSIEDIWFEIGST